MTMNIFKKLKSKRTHLFAGVIFGLVSLLAIATNIHAKDMKVARAADYSGVSSGFTHGSDGSISATFNVTNNTLDMKGWLLCFFTSKPSVDSNNKLTNSNDAHPYSYSSCSHYFFASNTSKTGSITVSWSASAADQKQAWTSGTSTGASGKTLKDYADDQNWHIVIGPRHYNTGWGNSGVGAGQDGYWENCDYYVGAMNDVFPEEEPLKTMNVSWGGGSVGYTGEPVYAEINVIEPSNGYTIRYRTTSSGEYNLTSNPGYTNAGDYKTYFKITASGYEPFEGVCSITIQKSYPTYTKPTIKEGLVYNGEDQKLLNPGSDNVVYSLDNTNYSVDIPTGKNAGTYTVYAKTLGDNNHNSVGPWSFTVTIGKANPVYDSPVGKTGLVYNGYDQELVDGGTSNVLYSLDGTNYSTDIPTGKNAGNYTVYYKVEEIDNYYGIEAQNFSVNIAKADPEYTEPTAKQGLVYNGSNQALINAGSDNVVYSLNNNDFSSDIPLGMNAGSYTVYYKVNETDNYNGVATQSFTVNIAKADPEYDAPTPINGLIYNKENQTLINAGSSNVIYNNNGGAYSSDLPVGKNAATYTVGYKIDETSNFNGLDPITFDVEINKATPIYTTVPTAKLGLKYTSNSQALINAGASDAGTVQYSLDGNNYSAEIPEKVLVGEYTVYYRVVGDSNYNNVDPQTLQISISANDKTALNSFIAQAKAYYGEIVSNYPDIASRLNGYISSAEAVSQDDNKTELEISNSKEDLIAAYDLAHAQVVDVIIESINEVRYTDKCLEDIIKAENAYRALSEEQKALVVNHEELLDARELYDKLEDVAEAIDAIGQITYDNDCYARILAAKEAYATLTSEEQLLLPTWFNNLNSAEDIYEMLGLITNLGEVRYTSEFKQALTNARNAFDALDPNEQAAIYNYQELLIDEEIYYDVDRVVNLVNAIAEELEYVGTHNPEIDKARKAYDSLTDAEKALIPQLTYETLTTSEEEYAQLKIEHERREIEDRESGVVIATEGGSGIPNTVSIDINNSSNSQTNMEDNIDYQTIQNAIPAEENISSICSIKLFEERDGEIVELSLADIDENMSVTIKIDVPEGIDEDNFRIVLLDDENNIIEMSYSYIRDTRQATISSNKLGTFAIITPNAEPTVATQGLPIAIVSAIGVVAVIATVGYFSIKNKGNKQIY